MCEVPGCGKVVRDRERWRHARRRAKDPDGLLRCASCAAKLRHRHRPIYGEVKLEAATTRRLAGLEAIAAALPDELRCTSTAVLGHIRAGGLVTQRVGWIHVAMVDQIPPYIDWLEERRREERRKRSESLRAYVATPAGQAHQARILTQLQAFHKRDVPAALAGDGLAPTKVAARLMGRSPTGLRSAGMLERQEFGRVVRCGINARDVLRLSVDKHVARSKLAKALSVLNGTDHYGRRRALSDAELAMVIELRAADSVTWSWRNLAEKVNLDRPSDLPAVSHMAVKRAHNDALAAPA